MLIENLTFRLRDGADATAFVAEDARVQTEVAYGKRGIVRRTTARNADGEWLVATFWWSAEVADAAGDISTPEWRALVDPESMRTSRYESLD